MIRPIIVADMPSLQGGRTLIPTVDYSIFERRWASPAPNPPPGNPPALTSREAQILLLIANGLSSKEMASHLRIGKPTVETFVRRLMTKFEARSRPQIVSKAFTAWLLRADPSGDVSLALEIAKMNAPHP